MEPSACPVHMLMPSSPFHPSLPPLPVLTRPHTGHNDKARPSNRKHTRRPHHRREGAQRNTPRPAARHPIASTRPEHHDQHARKAKTHRRRRQWQHLHWQPRVRHARPTFASQGFSTTLEHPALILGAGPGPTGALHASRPVDDGPAVEAASGRAQRGHGTRA